MKKLLIIFLSLALIIFSIKITAYAKDDYLKGYEEVTPLESQVLSGNVGLYHQRIRTLNNGVDDFWNNHTVNYAISNIKDGVKTVVYSSSYAHNWTAYTTRQAMKQWEKHHPGWICVAGTNADGFDIKNTKQPYHYYMEDGNFLRPQGDGIILGFKDDNTFIEGSPELTPNMYLRKYDENHKEIISDTLIDIVNRAPSEVGINLYTKDNQYPVDLTGYTVFDCTYDLCRCGYSNIYSFVRGTVEEIIPGVKDMTPKVGHFYLASKDESFKDSLVKGDYVKCEYKVTGAYEDATQIIGCPNKLIDGDVLHHKGSEVPFENITHPRTCLGIRENGDVILLTIDGRGSSKDFLVGASLYECEQILKKIGCVKAFNFDGGGSTTLAVRNSQGSFEVVNHPSDGAERQCGNHILFVMRDPGFKITTQDASYNSAKVKLEVTNEEYFKNVSNIKLHIGDKVYDYNDEGIQFTDLEPLSSYDVVVTYDQLDPDTNKVINSRLNASFETEDIPYPKEVIKVGEVNGTSIDILNLKNQYVSNLKVKIDDNEYELDGLDKITIKDLDLNHVYTIDYTYTYSFNGIVKEMIGESIVVKTLSFDRPYGLVINKILEEENKVKIGIEFIDPFNVITQGFVLVNDNINQEITHQEGANKIEITLDNLDSSIDNKIMVRLMYDNEKNVSINIDSNVISIPHKEVAPAPEKKGCSCKKNDVLISLLSLSTLAAYVLLKHKH